jgi:uncharacterized UBP type Zn finger protein
MKLNNLIPVFLLSMYSCTSMFAAHTTPYQGLPQSGNTCWLNAATQFLHHAFNNMPAVQGYERIFQYDAQEELSSMPKNNYQYFYKLFLAWRNGSTTIEKCADTLAGYCPRGFQRGQQNDATDYINNVFAGCGQRIQSIAQGIAYLYEVGEQAEIHCCRTKGDRHRASDQNPMTQKKPSKKPYIELEHNDQDAKMAGVISSLNIVETTADFFCHQCKEKVKIEKRKYFSSLPEILYMRAKVWGENFTTQKKYKITHYRVPLHVNFTNFATDSLKNSSQHLQYDLIGFTAHRGLSINGGHWIAVLKHDNQWVKYDDSTVSNIPYENIRNLFIEGQFHGSTPVSLLYRRAGQVQKESTPLITAPLTVPQQNVNQSSGSVSALSRTHKITSYLQNPYGCLIRGALGVGALWYGYRRPTLPYAQAAKYLGALSLVSSIYCAKQYLRNLMQ